MFGFSMVEFRLVAMLNVSVLLNIAITLPHLSILQLIFFVAHIYPKYDVNKLHMWGKILCIQIQTHSFAAPHIHHLETYINKKKINYQGINLQILISSNLLLIKLVEFYKTRQLSYLLSKSKNI